MYRDINNRMYPNTGYEFPAAGKLQNLRNSTTIEQVQNFHKLYYHPENIVLTMTGPVDVVRLLTAFKKSEEHFLKRRDKKAPKQFQHPWLTKLEKIYLDEDEVSEVVYPSDDETTGKMLLHTLQTTATL